MWTYRLLQPLLLKITTEDRVDASFYLYSTINYLNNKVHNNRLRLKIKFALIQQLYQFYQYAKDNSISLNQFSCSTIGLIIIYSQYNTNLNQSDSSIFQILVNLPGASKLYSKRYFDKWMDFFAKKKNTKNKDMALIQQIKDTILKKASCKLQIDREELLQVIQYIKPKPKILRSLLLECSTSLKRKEEKQFLNQIKLFISTKYKPIEWIHNKQLKLETVELLKKQESPIIRNSC